MSSIHKSYTSNTLSTYMYVYMTAKVHISCNVCSDCVKKEKRKKNKTTTSKYSYIFCVKTYFVLLLMMMM